MNTSSNNSNIPTVNDIDPETGKNYTKSRIKKLKKIADIIKRKELKKMEEQNKKLIEEQRRLQEIAEKEAKGEFVKLTEDLSLPKAEKIKSKNAKSKIGKRVKIYGWVDTIRKQGGLTFALLRDCSDVEIYIQCVLENKLLKCREACDLSRESSVVFTGTIYSDERAEGGVEMRVDYWELIGASPGEFSNIVDEKSNPSLAMDQRHLFLRLKENAQIFKMRSNIIRCFRDWLFDQDFTEVTPPTLVQTQVEGGSTLFHVDYFGSPAFLTQSSQLYLETCIASLGNVFCVVPSYRAEKTRTRRHVCEYTHYEAELPFIKFDDLLQHLEDIVVSVCELIVSRHGDLLKRFNPSFKAPKRPFKRMNHSEAIQFCREHQIYKDPNTREHFEPGDDIPEAPERQMIEIIGEPVLLCRFPAKMKPFYMQRCPEDNDATESVDLLMPGVGEVVGGSMRETNYERLKKGFEDKDIDPENYYWYLDLRKYGTVSHGGYGLGIERFLCWVLNRDHIRDVCLYPRFTNRCKP